MINMRVYGISNIGRPDTNGNSRPPDVNAGLELHADATYCFRSDFHPGTYVRSVSNCVHKS